MPRRELPLARGSGNVCRNNGIVVSPPCDHPASIAYAHLQRRFGAQPSVFSDALSALSIVSGINSDCRIRGQGQFFPLSIFDAPVSKTSPVVLLFVRRSGGRTRPEPPINGGLRPAFSPFRSLRRREFTTLCLLIPVHRRGNSAKEPRLRQCRFYRILDRNRHRRANTARSSSNDAATACPLTVEPSKNARAFHGETHARRSFFHRRLRIADRPAERSISFGVFLFAFPVRPVRTVR